MDIVFKILIVLHFIGLASLLGGFLVQMSTKPRGINNAMLHGVLTQVVTGIAMVGILSAGLLDGEDPVNNGKISIKLLVAVVVLVAVLLGRRKPADQQQPYWAAAGALTLVNVIVAVFV
jgi:cytochrome bd-type quinol oxidase subunit 2